MSRKNISDTAQLYRSLEEQARLHPVRAIRLTGKGSEPLGLLFVGNDSSGPEVASALAGLRFLDQPRTASTGNPEGKLPDLAWLREQLAMELAQVQQTRLPCALLLITLSGGNTLAGQAAAALAPSLHPGDLLAGFHKNTLALIMPGASVGKARKRAEEIRTALRNEAFSKGTSLALGIAVCHAYETIPADQFLALAQTELARAAKMGSDAICQSSAVRAEDSCQVTVEERAQLWMQPRKASPRAAGMAA
jgi:GGDEF domain-containing protein